MIPFVDTGAVEAHYTRENLGEVIVDALRAAGLDLERLEPDDLAPVDEFHIRGREATDELVEMLRLEPGQTVLDVGCGIGGACRRLAAAHGAAVTGVDLTREYCEVATMLAERTGLDDRVEFRPADALALPFDDGTFDVVWTQHTAMNIADKPRLYAELARVLRPGGRLAVYDVVAGPGGDVHFPVPWARSPEISFLVSPDELLALLEGAGFRIVESRDVTGRGLEWFRNRLTAFAGKPPAVGIHLLLGADAKEIFANQVRNLEEGRIGLLQVVAER